jgi:transposase-like protein
VPERARRRTFTAQYKLEVLAAYDAAGPGEKGAISRREGLYSSHIVDWRRSRDSGALAGPAGCSADVQRERGGVIGGDRVREHERPRRVGAGRGLVFMVSAGCSFC